MAEPILAEGGMLREILEMINRWNDEFSKIEDHLDRVEARRFLLRVLAMSVECYIEGWNPDAPHFRSTVTDVRKVFADSPDTDYIRSNMLLSQGRIYRIYGTIPKTTLYWGIQLYRTKGMVGKHIPDSSIPVDADGNFEILVTALPKDKLPEKLKKLPLLTGDGDEVAVIVRQYFVDRRVEVPIIVHIERLELSKHASNMDSESFMRGARLTLSDVDTTIKKTLLAHQYLSAQSDSAFIIPEADQLFPTRDNRYTVAWCHNFNAVLPNDDFVVVLVRGVRPKGRYFSCVVYNRFLESLDYTRFPVYLNHSRMLFAPDGSFELAVASHNPGHRNFISTVHHNGVYILLRELLPEGDPQTFELEQTTASALKKRKNKFFLADQQPSKL